MSKMKIEEKDLSGDSCNFCRPKYIDNKLHYKYTYVYGIQKDSCSGLYATTCPDCLDELKAFTDGNIK